MSAFGMCEMCFNGCLCAKCVGLATVGTSKKKWPCKPCLNCTGVPDEEAQKDGMCGWVTQCKDFAPLEKEEAQ